METVETVPPMHDRGHISIPWAMSNEDGEYAHLWGHVEPDRAVRAALATAAWEGWLGDLIEGHGGYEPTVQHLKAGVVHQWLKEDPDDNDRMVHVSPLVDQKAEAWTQVQL